MPTSIKLPLLLVRQQVTGAFIELLKKLPTDKIRVLSVSQSQASTQLI